MLSQLLPAESSWLLALRLANQKIFEGLAVDVVRRNEVIDALHELFNASKRATTDDLVGNQREEALDLV